MMTTENKPFLDIFAILKYLPHRYPFLLVDRVLECTPGETIRAIMSIIKKPGELSRVQRPSMISTGPRCKGLKRAASETLRQKPSSA